MVVVGFGKFDLFALVGYGFVRKNIKTRLPLEKKLFRGYKIRPTATFWAVAPIGDKVLPNGELFGPLV